MKLPILILVSIIVVACASAPIRPAPEEAPDEPHFWNYKDDTYPALVKAAPKYPEDLMREGQEGWVLIEYSLSESGEVVDPTVLRASPKDEFDAAAIEAVKRWRYTPQVADRLNQNSSSTLRRLFTFELE